MDWVTVMGYVAGACTTSSFLPQAIQIVKTKHTKDLSLSMYSILTSGLMLWSIYGLINHDWPLLIANLVTLLLAGWIFVLKLRYG
ncbi:MAG: SemiSWEET transporter [Nitrospiraceae bacterium]|nr:SemiSWEET transporter [Nitrospiraceae bacterium]MCW5783698.1 SemiSWEET family sugar transporter [Nitrospirales bacterium]